MEEHRIDDESLCYTDDQGSRRRLSPKVAFDNGKRPGWLMNTNVICFNCYEKDHISPQCPLKLQNLNHVVKNYEALSADIREKVPDKSYKDAKTYLTIQAGGARNDATQPTKQPESKN